MKPADKRAKEWVTDGAAMNGISLESSVRAISEQVSCFLSDEAVILNLRSGIYYGLNDAGAKVWQLVQEPTTVREIRDVLVDEYLVPEEVCTRDVHTLLEQLVEWGLIELGNGAAPRD